MGWSKGWSDSTKPSRHCTGSPASPSIAWKRWNDCLAIVSQRRWKTGVACSSRHRRDEGDHTPVAALDPVSVGNSRV